MPFRNFIHDRPVWQYVLFSLALLALVLWIDLITDPDLFLSPFYMLPVIAVAWGAGKRWGFFLSILSSASWMYAVLRNRAAPVHPKTTYLVIDLILRAAFYFFTAWLVSLSREIGRKLQDTVHERTSALQAEIIQRQNAQTALQSLAADLAEAEDAHRRQLAHDIHDALGQNLSLLKLNLEGLRRDSAADGAIIPTALQRRIDEEIEAVDELIRQTRTLTFELYPALLDDLGLSAALEWQGEEFHRRTGVEVTVSETGQRFALATPMMHYLFRALKELMNNAIKHGRAREVIVSMRWGESSLRIVVDDDGCGFDVEAIPAPGQRQGLGLRGIKERLHAQGGTLQIESKPNEGTRAILEVKLRAPALAV